jgi:hypothetical protein
VLDISVKYDLDIATREAVAALQLPENRNQLTPCAWFRIIWEFRLQSLYEDAASALLDIRPFPYSFSQKDMGDLETFFLAKAHEIFGKVLEARGSIVVCIPPFYHDQDVCFTSAAHQSCEQNWREAYTSNARLLAHPTRYYSSRQVFDRLSRENIQNMNAVCKAGMLDDLKEAFDKEMGIFENGKTELVAILKQESGPAFPRRKFCPEGDTYMDTM